MDCSLAYNAIIGRLMLNVWRAITSLYHLLVKFPTDCGIGEDHRDQMTIMNIEKQRVNVEPMEGLETISLDDEHVE